MAPEPKLPVAARIRNRYLFGSDLLLFASSTILAFALRFEGFEWGDAQNHAALLFLLIVLPLKLAIFWRVFTPEVVARRLERALKRAGHEHRERQLTVRLHPEVALYLLEEEPKLLQTLSKLTGLDLELRDDPMMRLDEFRLMSRPAGRDVTELYAVA
jgi:hypothetical protein